LPARVEINLDGFNLIIGIFIPDLRRRYDVSLESIGQALRWNVTHHQWAYILAKVRNGFAGEDSRNQTA
jgi:hypothetical protein